MRSCVYEERPAIQERHKVCASQKANMRPRRLRPDLILQDIVYAVHPNIDVDDKTTFSFKVDTASDSIKGGACPYNDLLGMAPNGKQYVDFTMEVSGMNRFEVENKLVENIIPKIASDERLDSKSVDAFFEKPQKAGYIYKRLQDAFRIPTHLDCLL